MKKIIKRQGEHKVSQWSGGATTEICIYPFEADYQDRTFAYRISSATIELAESDFSKLPNYQRILLVLDGQTELVFQEQTGERRALLAPYQQASFSGGITTKSYGQCIDFNLMHRPELTGTVEAVSQNGERELVMKTHYLYYFTESVQVKIRENAEWVQYDFKRGESLHLSEIHEKTAIHLQNLTGNTEPLAIEVKVSPMT